MKRHRLILVVLGSAIAAVAVVVPFALWQPEAQELQAVSAAPMAVADEVDQTSQPEIAAEPQTVDLTPVAMPLLAGGLLIGEEPPTGWSHLVLHAVPRVVEGDVDRVSKLVNKLTGLFHLVVVANVGQASTAGHDNYRIENVAIGLATDVQGVEMTVSSQSPGGANAQFDFMARTALGQNEATLKSAQQVARTDTMFVFDHETIMWREGEHLRTIYRHALVIAPDSGRLATLVWALAPHSKGRYQFCGESLQLLPNALHEDRQLHVDASKFSLGIPTQQSFALIRLPQGKAVPLSPALHDVVESRFDRLEDALQLETALRTAIGWDRRDERVSTKIER